MKRLLVFALLLAGQSSFAGAPMLITGPSYPNEGQPVVWNNSQPIQYRVDGGVLGAMSNVNATSEVANAFAKWAAVQTASLSFSKAGSVQGVTDGDVSTMAELNAVLDTCYAGTQSPVLFDNLATLLPELTGDDGVVGLSGPCVVDANGKIKSAFALLSYPTGMPLQILQAEVVHELGHFIGLDHSEIASPIMTGTTQEDTDSTPTMGPVLYTPNMGTLEIDDIAWVSKMYPSTRVNTSFGTIAGNVLFSSGKYPVQYVEVIVRSTTDMHKTKVASMSGYRFTDNFGQPYTADYLPCSPPTVCSNGTLGHNPGSEWGSHDPVWMGRYEVLVPPGTYTVEISPGTTPFGTFGWNSPGPQEFWDEDESATDQAGPYFDGPFIEPGHVTVSAGQTVSGIDIILNGTDPDFDVFEEPISSLMVHPFEVLGRLAATTAVFGGAQ